MSIIILQNKALQAQCNIFTTISPTLLNANQTINDNILVPSNSTLVITNCTIQFAAGAKIICEPNSYLQILDATLTSASNTAWHGIQLQDNLLNTFGSGAECEVVGSTIENS